MSRETEGTTAETQVLVRCVDCRRIAYRPAYQVKIGRYRRCKPCACRRAALVRHRQRIRWRDIAILCGDLGL
jgi:hypothetical protein